MYRSATRHVQDTNYECGRNVTAVLVCVPCNHSGNITMAVTQTTHSMGNQEEISLVSIPALTRLDVHALSM